MSVNSNLWRNARQSADIIVTVTHPPKDMEPSIDFDPLSMWLEGAELIHARHMISTMGYYATRGGYTDMGEEHDADVIYERGITYRYVDRREER